MEYEQVEKRVIKLGTQVVVKDNQINVEVLQSVAEEVLQLRRRDIFVILVTSGAVTLGRNAYNPDINNEKEDEIDKGLFSTIGQRPLMESWNKALRKAAVSLGIREKIHVSEGILTRDDFRNPKLVRNINDVIQKAIQQDSISGNITVPVYNGNDLITTEHLRNDNDGLASDIACAIRANVLVILSNIEGLYTGNPSDVDTQLIHHVLLDTHHRYCTLPETQYVSGKTSMNGTGGMGTKLQAIHRYLSHVPDGIAYIGNGTRDHILQLLEQSECGTTFRAKPPKQLWRMSLAELYELIRYKLPEYSW